MSNAAQVIEAGKAVLGIEFGSTRIKAVAIDGCHRILSSGLWQAASASIAESTLMYMCNFFILPPLWELFIYKIVLTEFLGRNRKAVALLVELAVFQVAGLVVELVTYDSECVALIVVKAFVGESPSEEVPIMLTFVGELYLALVDIGLEPGLAAEALLRQVHSCPDFVHRSLIVALAQSVGSLSLVEKNLGIAHFHPALGTLYTPEISVVLVYELAQEVSRGGHTVGIGS